MMLLTKKSAEKFPKICFDYNQIYVKIQVTVIVIFSSLNTIIQAVCSGQNAQEELVPTFLMA